MLTASWRIAANLASRARNLCSLLQEECDAAFLPPARPTPRLQARRTTESCTKGEQASATRSARATEDPSTTDFSMLSSMRSSLKPSASTRVAAGRLRMMCFSVPLASTVVPARLLAVPHYFLCALSPCPPSHHLPCCRPRQRSPTNTPVCYLSHYLVPSVLGSDARPIARCVARCLRFPCRLSPHDPPCL